MVQNLIARALKPQLGPQPDRYINSVVGEGVWDLAGGHFKVVEQAAPGMSVRVGSGVARDMAVVEGAAALSGRYVIQNQDAYVGSGNTDLSIGNGDPSDPRIDLVVLRVWDDEMDSSGLTKTEVEVVPGTPAVTPVAPATPDGAIALASILVPANESTSITNGDITDLRAQVALEGRLVAPVVQKTSATLTQNDAPGAAFVQWGTEEASFANPGRPVTVEARLNGYATCSDGETTIPEWRVDISLDGGATWSEGVVGSGGLQRNGSTVRIQRCPTPAAHLVSGTPTGEVQVRAQVRDVLTDSSVFTNGHIVATMIG